MVGEEQVSSGLCIGLSVTVLATPTPWRSTSPALVQPRGL